MAAALNFYWILLLEPGLIDEFHFLVHPVFVGEGRKLLDDIESTVFRSGCVALRYVV